MSLVVIKSALASDGERLDPSALTVGDLVAWLYSGRFNGPEATLARVSRLTPTQVVTHTIGRGLEYRFDRETGRMRGERGWGVYLMHPNDPRVVRARVLRIARVALQGVETVTRTASCKDVDTATGHLENVRTIINSALDRMAKLLTATPDSLIPERDES